MATATKKKSKAKSKTRTKTKARKLTKLPTRKKATKKATKKPAKKTAKKKTIAKKVTTKKVPAKKATSPARKIAAITAKSVATTQTATSVSNTKPVGLQIGDQAPGFTLVNQNGEQVNLGQYLGRRVVLYFYPKDDTPGCTVEACSFRDNLPRFEGINAVILGVSFDDQASHQKFIEKYGLNFQLLSDLDKSVANAYGVYVEKNMYGNKTMGIERSTFLIDSNGKIAQIFRRVKVEGHTEEVLAALHTVQ